MVDTALYSPARGWHRGDIVLLAQLNNDNSRNPKNVAHNIFCTTSVQKGYLGNEQWIKKCFAKIWKKVLFYQFICFGRILRIPKNPRFPCNSRTCPTLFHSFSGTVASRINVSGRQM